MDVRSLPSQVAICALILCPACSKEDSAKPGANAPQQRERVEIAAPPQKQTTAEEMVHSRQGELRIASDVRDAWTAPIGSTLEIDLPASPEDHWTSALALQGWKAGVSIPAVQLNVELDADGAKTHQKQAISLSLQEALTTWAPFLVPIPNAPDAVHVKIRVKVVGVQPPAGWEALRVCLQETPRTAKADAKLPNVLVISIDTLRADHLGCYGHSRDTSPRIDALVKQGVQFERAYSAAPWTLPSYGSLFTSVLPADHRAGIVTQRESAWGKDEDAGKFSAEPMRADLPTLAEQLAASGYLTVAFVNNPYLVPQAGVDRGFQQYTSYQYNAKNGVDLAAEWIVNQSDRRWFVFLHLFDPHFPYAPPAPFDTRFRNEPLDQLGNAWPPNLDELRKGGVDETTKQRSLDYYDGEIAFVDGEIGRLLDILDAKGITKDTLIVLHSDHGEEFWEHGSCDHGHTQYDELLRVPLAIVWPSKLPAKRVATRVRTLDVMPTLLELVGAKAPGGIAGKSLMPLVEGSESADRDAIAEAIHRGPREIKAFLRGNDKLIATGASMNLMFDLAQDPKELHDRAKDAADVVQKLRALLAEHHARALKNAKPSRPAQFDNSRTRGIGYAGDDDAAPRKKP